MPKKAPGKSHREGLTIVELLRMFPDDDAAEKWFEGQRWPEGRFCPDCGSANYAVVAGRKPMPYRCRDCRKHFSVRKGTVMQSSKLDHQTWAIAIYLVSTGIKGTASMKVYRDLGIRQATAWHLMHRIREAFDVGDGQPFIGPVEVDETYIGGKRKNMPKAKRSKLSGRGSIGKAAVVGAKDRDTNQISAQVVQNTDRETLHGFVTEKAATNAVIFTDDAKAYRGLKSHESVCHSVGEYVRGQAHTNGIESFWAMLKRGYQGTFHKMSPKHLDRYVAEFAGRHNIRDLDTLAQMTVLAQRLAGKYLCYADPIADNGLGSGARS